MTSKPSATVKQFLKPAKDKTDDEHIYANNPAPYPSSNRPQPAGRSSIDSAAPVAEPAALEEADSFDDDGDDDGPVYGNVANVYAVFKASKPELDAVQKCLVDRLASTNLQNEFRVRDHYCYADDNCVYHNEVLALFSSSSSFSPEGRPGMYDVSLLSGISGLSFDPPFLSVLQRVLNSATSSDCIKAWYSVSLTAE